tara:strand:+ start:92 stop:772 length:681 start_codon:yes stop_codon:yes gene_type:complete
MKKLLVLLFLLMITLNSNANQFSYSSIIGIDQDGNYYTNSILEKGFNPESHTLQQVINQTIARNYVYPDRKVLIAAHQNVTFERVFELIKLLKKNDIVGINIIDYSKYLSNDLIIYLGEINFAKGISDAKKDILKDTWINNISRMVKSVWGYQGVTDGRSCDVFVVQSKNGEVKAVDIQNCNVSDIDKAIGFKNSIERAVFKSSPLPLAPDDSVFDSEIHFIFTAN